MSLERLTPSRARSRVNVLEYSKCTDRPLYFHTPYMTPVDMSHNDQHQAPMGLNIALPRSEDNRLMTDVVCQICEAIITSPKTCAKKKTDRP